MRCEAIPLRALCLLLPTYYVQQTTVRCCRCLVVYLCTHRARDLGSYLTLAADQVHGANLGRKRIIAVVWLARPRVEYNTC